VLCGHVAQFGTDLILKSQQLNLRLQHRCLAPSEGTYISTSVIVQKAWALK
jgi:hypothetical protein